MFMKKVLYGATLSVAALAAGFAGTSASAGGCYSGGYSSGYHGGYSGGHGYTYRTRGHYTSRRSTHHDHVTVRPHGNHQHVQERVTHHTEPAYRYQRVYRAPVYRTYYDDCGYPYRVQVRAGYYENVQVGYGH